MKLHAAGVLVVALLLNVSAPAAAQAGEPVDLGGKQAIVDPRELKKHDPTPPAAPAPPPEPKRQCQRKVRFCTEVLSDGRCRLWDFRVAWVDC